MILVCYLLPAGKPFDLRGIEFGRSYRAHVAGLDHDFLLILKDGAGDACAWWDWDGVLEYHSNDGLDVGSLQRVCAEHPEYDQVMWLGAHSRILADGWLRKFHDAARLDGVGAVAASASFEAGVSGERPNPHLRTSALMISPSLLNSLDFAPARSRGDTYQFEHGQGSLYRRLRERGLEGLVVGRSGCVYRENAWATSDTFRHGDQGELLIADKHSDNFAKAPPEERLALARAAGWEP